MYNNSRRTFQQSHYESSYQLADSDYGIPDRKITEGRPVKGQHILVIGGGAGSDVWFLAEDNEVVMLDYAESGLKVAEKHGIRGHQTDLNQDPTLPFDDASFDLVVLKDILEHILDPLAVLEDAARVLKDDGTLVISVPNHFYLPMRLRLLRGRNLVWKTFAANHARTYDEWNYMHIRFFTYRGFRRFLAQAKLVPRKWYWDFGDLAHYRNPDMWLEPQLWKKANGRPISRRGKLGLYLLRPLWGLFNIVFPKPLRRGLVSLAPGLLCSGFYVRCAKTKSAV